MFPLRSRPSRHDVLAARVGALGVFVLAALLVCFQSVSWAAPLPGFVSAPQVRQSAACDRFYAVNGSSTSVIEAELASAQTGAFTLAQDASRYGGAYATVPASAAPNDLATRLSFQLDVSNGGTFSIWLLGYGSNGSSDSFFVQIDSSPLVQANLTQGSWGWKKASATISLPDGAHTLAIIDREPGASIDRLLLTRSANLTPAGSGGDVLAPQCRTTGATSTPSATTTITATPSATPTATATSAATPSATPTSTPSQGCQRYYTVNGDANTFIEAELPSATGGAFAFAADAARSGGYYALVPSTASANDPATRLSYQLDVSNGGTFSIWLLGYGPNGSSDSFNLQVDNGLLVQANLMQSWGWKKASASLSLPSGTHTLTIIDREPGASADRLLLTRSTTFAPSGVGDAATALCRDQAPPAPAFLPPRSYSLAGSNPWAMAAGDVNGDAIVDVVTADRNSNTISVALGNGQGAFAPANSYATNTASPYSLALGDVNGDQRLDIVVVGQANDRVSVLLNGGMNGGFLLGENYAVGSQPHGVALADFNGDGKIDIATSNAASNNVSLLLGNGAGTFGSAATFPVGMRPLYLAAGDVNGDAKSDLVVPNGSDNTLSVLLGDGQGGFQPAISYPVGVEPEAVALADLNGDGRLDAVTTNFADRGISVLLGTGSGTFAAATPYSIGDEPRRLAIGDVNGDGKLDVVAAVWYSNRAVFFLGKGDGSLYPGSNVWIDGWQLSSPVLADFNRDSKLDIAVISFTYSTIQVALQQ